LPEKGFQTLKRRVLQILDKCRVESLPISEAHANSFLEVIDNLIVEQKQKLQEIQNKEEEDVQKSTVICAITEDVNLSWEGW